MSTSKTWPGGATGASPTSYSIPISGEFNWANLNLFLTALADGAQSTTFQKFAVRKATSSPVTMLTSDCVVVTNLTVAGAVTVNLPAGANKQVFYICDDKLDASTNNITINRAGADTIGGSTSYVISENGGGVGIVYNSSDTDWKIFTRFNRLDTGVMAIANGGTNSSTALNNNRFMVSSAGAIVEASAVTGSRVVVSDANGLPSAASATTTQVNYLSSATGTTGTTSTNIVFSTSPSFTTPNIGVATATSVNKVAITAPASSATITVADGKTLTASNSLTFTGTDSTSFAFPSTSGTVATLAATQALTNKDYDGGTASNSNRITVPSASLSTLTGLTRKEGTIVYATDTDQLLADDGASLNAIGSGSGEKNYILNPSNATNWTASGAGITVATSVTASALPREFTTKSGILITGVSGSTAYVYYRFTLDDVDLNRKLKIKIDLKPVSGYVASDMKIDLYSNTASAYNGTSTRIATSSDSSSICAIPNMTGQFQTTVDMPDSTAPYMELRVGLNASSTQAIVISDVVVGPGLQPQGAVVEEWKSYTPTTQGLGSISANSTQYRRVGDSMEIRIVFASGITTNVEPRIGLPSGYTISAPDRQMVGSLGLDATSGGVFSLLATSGQTYLRLGQLDNSSNTGYAPLAGNATLVNSVTYAGYATVVISEWSGSGTVNLAQNDVEYASNSSTSDADDTTSFAYGPSGSAIPTTQTSAHRKRVRFQTPYTDSDIITLEVQAQSGAPWVVFQGDENNGVQSYMIQNSVTYGLATRYVSGAPTDFDLYIGQYAQANGATYGASGRDWSTPNGNGMKWRLKKAKGGQAVGFGKATDGSLGLVNTYTGSISTTFTADGSGGTSASKTVYAQRLGDWVTVHVPSTTLTSGTSSTKMTSNTALPSWARPLTAIQSGGALAQMLDNNGQIAVPALSWIDTSGIITYQKTATGSTFTNSATMGTNIAHTHTYYVGTGS